MRRAELVVIGAGPAGTTAAVQCSRLGVSPLLLDATGRAGGLVENAHRVENYPGPARALSGPRFVERLRAHLDRFGVAVRRGRVSAIARHDHGFRLSGTFGALLARAVIVATGTAPRPLHLRPSGPLRGPRVFHEVREVLPLRPSRVAVIGAGEAAFDYSLSLASAGAAVELIARGDRVSARGRLLRLVQRRSGVQVLLGTSVEDVRAVRGGVELALSEGGQARTTRYDALLVAIGRHSSADELLPEELRARRSEALEPLPGLFVIGDARLGSLGQVGIAVGDGLAAAAAAVECLERC